MKKADPVRDPETPEEWQQAVDAAAGARVIADCMMYGLLDGPAINVARCDDILARGLTQGIRASRPAAELALEIIRGINAEKDGTP
jgi:hypothetical protein